LEGLDQALVPVETRRPEEALALRRCQMDLRVPSLRWSGVPLPQPQLHSSPHLHTADFNEVTGQLLRRGAHTALLGARKVASI